MIASTLWDKAYCTRFTGPRQAYKDRICPINLEDKTRMLRALCT